MLTAGALLLSSAHNTGLDLDPDALTQSQRNLAPLGPVDLLRGDVACFPSSLTCDTVLMNPPFGTRVAGIDMRFLEYAAQIANTAVYSLHKTATRAHVLKRGAELGLEGTVVAELR
jgi:predicted RNA methylase